MALALTTTAVAPTARRKPLRSVAIGCPQAAGYYTAARAETTKTPDPIAVMGVGIASALRGDGQISWRMPRTRRLSPAESIRQLERTLRALTTAAPPENVVRARAEALLAHLGRLPVAILIADNRARYVDVNHAATTLTGYSRAELLRLSLWDLTPERNRTAGARLWKDFLRRGRMSGGYQLRRKNGTLVSVRYLAIANVLPGVHVSALAATRRALGPRRSPPRVKRER
jgi:PAS domain S-box-containing protein